MSASGRSGAESITYWGAGVVERIREWYQLKTDIKDRDVERLLLIEKERFFLAYLLPNNA